VAGLVVLARPIRENPLMSYPPPAGQPQPEVPGQPQPPGTYPPPGAYTPGQVGYQPSQQLPPVSQKPKRPWNVTLVAVLTFIVGVLDVAAGISALIFRNELRLQTELGLSANNIAISGAVVLVIGAIVLLLSFGLFGGSRLSRGVIAFFSVVRIALAVVAIVLATTINSRVGFLFDIGLSIIVLLLLYAGARTKAFFARG
jgi:hypothetical protein